MANVENVFEIDAVTSEINYDKAIKELKDALCIKYILNVHSS